MREPEHKYAAALPFITRARFMCFHDGSLNVLPGFSPGRIACASQRPEGHQVQTRASFRGVVDWYWEPGTLGRSWDFRMKILKIIGILACLWLKILRWFKASNPSCFDAFCIGRLTVRAPVHLLHELKIKDLKLDTFRKPSDQQDSLSPPFCIPSVGNTRKTTSHLKPLKQATPACLNPWRCKLGLHWMVHPMSLLKAGCLSFFFLAMRGLKDFEARF